MKHVVAYTMDLIRFHKMPKSKPQAEKRKEREEQIAEQARLRLEKAQKKRELHQARLNNDSGDDDCLVTLQIQQRRGRARLVMNHSTHIEGLIELLRLVCIRLDPRFTITPGVIHSDQSLSSKKGGLSFRTQRSDTESALRLLAMNGGSAQEVFISVPEGYEKEKLEGLIQDCLERRSSAISDDSNSDNEKTLDLVNPNRQIAKKRANEWKEEHKAHHKRIKATEAQAEEKKELEARERTLRTKVGSEEAEVYAERDEAIVKGKKRGKYAMK